MFNRWMFCALFLLLFSAALWAGGSRAGRGSGTPAPSPTATLSGQVVGIDGNPAPNITVYSQDRGGTELGPTATTDQNGMFTLKDVPALTSLSVYATNWPETNAPAQGGPWLVGGAVINLAGDTQKTLPKPIALAPTGTVSGTLFYPDGKPAINALVISLGISIKPIPSPETNTNQKGEFTLRGVPAGASVGFYARDFDVTGPPFKVDASGQNSDTNPPDAPPRSAATAWIRVLQNAENKIDIHLKLLPPSKGTLTGRVVDINGKPAPGVRVRYKARGSIEPLGEFATTREDGSFTLYVFNGEFLVYAATWNDPNPPADGGPWLVGWTSVHMTGNQTMKLPEDIKLQPTGTVSGIVLDPQGNPKAGIYIYSITGASGVPLTTTDINGAFTLRGVPVGASNSLTARNYDSSGRIPGTVVNPRAGPPPGSRWRTTLDSVKVEENKETKIELKLEVEPPPRLPPGGRP